jgi:hypothetical protein
MKKTLYTILGFLAFALISSASAKEKFYPEQDPVLKYDLPAGWSYDDKDKNETVTIGSESERVVANFAAIPKNASMELFKELFPDVLKMWGKGAKILEQPSADTWNGLKGYSATFATTIEGKPSKCLAALLNGGNGQSILVNIIIVQPDTLSKKDSSARDHFLDSLKLEQN